MQSIPRYSSTEVLVALLCLAIVGRIVTVFFWNTEYHKFEQALLEAIGLGGGAVYWITVPVATYFVYRRYQQASAESKVSGKPVVRLSVMVFAGLSLVAVIVCFLEIVRQSAPP